MEELEQNRRRSLDGMQIAAAVCVGTLILGEVALLVWMFQTHRSRRMQVQATEVVEVPSTRSNTLPPASNALSVVFSNAVTSRTAAVEQPVLNPALKIQRVQRDGAELQVRLRAQTGEQEFSAAAARMSVEWRLADGSTPLEWIALPAAWENFTVKTLAARCNEAAVQVRGYVVRTYYRQQLQDQIIEGSLTP